MKKPLRRSIGALRDFFPKSGPRSEVCVNLMDGGKRQYRNRLQIAADIIEIAKNGSRKTRIMYLGNLSFELLHRYLEMLVNFGLIQTRDGDSSTYVATEKGLQFLERYTELRRYSELAESKKRELERSLTSMLEKSEEAVPT
jgi:predicted transcriptional regulator